MRRKLLVTGLGLCLLIAALFWLWPRRRPNILLITLDTTRADRLGCYGYRDARTPVLDALAASGVICQNVCTVAPLTLPAHTSMFTGLYPSESGVRTNGRGRLDDAVPTLAEALRTRGYETAGFVGAFVLDRKFGLGQGFQTYDDDFVSDEPGGDGMLRQRPGRAVVDAALRWLERKRSKPFLCWVHFYDPHAPYLGHEDVFGDEFAGRPYDAEIAYVDRQIGRLVEFLHNQMLDSQTLVVVAGDHGEGFGEHLEQGHGLTLYEEVLRVPLIIRQPERVPAGRAISDRISLVDLSPTILDLAGIPELRKVSGSSFGRGLVGDKLPSAPGYAATDEPFLVNGWSPLRSLYDGSWKYVRTARPELYDLAADPQETRDLAEALPDVLEKMERRLAEIESRMVPREESATQLSASERRALEGLGYLGAGRPAPAERAAEDLPDVKDMLRFNAAIAEADKLVQSGSPDAAVDRLQQIIAEAPLHTEAYVRLGKLLAETGHFDQAERTFRAVLGLRPQLVGVHFRLGMVLLMSGHADQAIPEFLEELENNPEFAKAHYNLGVAFSAVGQPHEALDHFDAAIEIERGYSMAYLGRGNLLTNLGRIPEAVSDYEEALKYDPNLAEAHEHLGLVLRNQGQIERAREHLARAAELSRANGPKAP
jgi:arylsulfatase A-like enzyme/Tfp pilus assembly protein PilF